MTHIEDEGSGTALIKEEENGQNKPPSLTSRYLWGKLSWEAYFARSLPLISAVSRTLIFYVCVYANSTAVKLGEKAGPAKQQCPQRL